jgi:hypothetical protein
LPDLLPQRLAQSVLRARHVVEHHADHRQRVGARHGRVDGRNVLTAVAHRLQAIHRHGRDSPCHDQPDGGGLQALRLRRAASAEEDRDGYRHGDADDDAKIFQEMLQVGV